MPSSTFFSPTVLFPSQTHLSYLKSYHKKKTIMYLANNSTLPLVLRDYLKSVAHHQFHIHYKMNQPISPIINQEIWHLGSSPQISQAPNTLFHHSAKELCINMFSLTWSQRCDNSLLRIRLPQRSFVLKKPSCPILPRKLILQIGLLFCEKLKECHPLNNQQRSKVSQCRALKMGSQAPYQYTSNSFGK